MAVPGVTKIEVAYIMHKLAVNGSCCVRVCSKRLAQTIVSELCARGLNATLTRWCGNIRNYVQELSPALEAATPVADACDQGKRFCVFLLVTQRDMQHMLHIGRVLTTRGRLPKCIAEAVMQEVQELGTALVCVCDKQKAEEWAAWFKVNRLVCNVEPAF